MSDLELSNHTFQSKQGFYTALWDMNYLPSYNPFSTDETFQASRYFIAISLLNHLASYIHEFHQFRPLRLPPSMDCIIHIHFVFQWQEVSALIKILTSLSLVSTVIHRTYPHNPTLFNSLRLSNNLIP